MKFLIAIISTVLIAVAGFYTYGRIRNLSDDIPIERLSRFPSKPFSEHIRFATYNIAHGRGPKLGESNDAGSDSDKEIRLKAIGEFFKKTDVDIVILNEVDFSAYWSGNIDQATLVAQAGGFPFLARQANYDVLLPMFSLQFGNVVLSRFPIKSAQRVTLPPLSIVESWFAGNHDVVNADIQLNEELTIKFLGLHLEVRDEAVRIQAVNKLRQNLIRGELVVLAGDLNSQLSNGDSLTAVSELLDNGELEAFPSAGMNSKTFPSASPNRTIDWIVYSSEWEFISGFVPELTHSDHLPVIVDLKLKMKDH